MTLGEWAIVIGVTLLLLLALAIAVPTLIFIGAILTL